MTVCIAAIYNNNSVLGISDRMVTGGYGDITFEPPITKIFNITNSIAILTAGDQSIQIQVYAEASKIIGKKIEINPTKWIDLSDVADIYSECYIQLRNKTAERLVLSIYGLTFESFQTITNIENSKLLNDRLEKFNETFGTIETIITGVDSFGPHIYIVRNGQISCHDKLGFAAIGVGTYHALSHFMLSSYSRSSEEPKSLLTIHQAKKKAEVSPGVGKDSDMCVIGPGLGTFKMITKPPFPMDIISDLDKFYKDYKKTIEKLDKKTEDKIGDYLKHLITSDTTPKQETGVSKI